MTFRVRIAPVALRQLDEFARYLGAYDEEFALEQIARLDRILSTHMAETPLTWGYFVHMGAPYRAYLFRVGRRTQYWIIYTVDEGAGVIDVLQFWNAMRDPRDFEI
jgi:mRNA-degrading endonuclease RelE of RelBE toxin-antitoxin system